MISRERTLLKSVTPVATLRKGKSTPDGELKLSWSILMITVSVTTAVPCFAVADEALLISPQKGDSGSWLSSSQSADGTFRAARLAGKVVETSGSSSSMSPRGNGLVVFTLKN